MKINYCLNLESSGLKVDFSLNDVPLFRRHSPRPAKYSNLMNPWLHRGDNFIHLKFESFEAAEDLPPELKALAQDEKKRKLDVDLTDLDSGKSIWKFQYPAANIHRALPFELPPNEGIVRVGEGVEKWSWEQPSPPELTPLLEQDLFDAFLAIYRAFTERDAPALMSLGKTRNQETAVSLGMAPPAYEADCLKDWNATFADHAPALLPQVKGPHDLLFEPCWKKCLYRVTTLDELPPLATQRDSTGMKMSFDVYLGQVNGKWVWVR